MTKITTIWLALISLVTTLLIFIFNGSSFPVCYSARLPAISIPLLQSSPEVSCLIGLNITVFALLFLGPLLITLAASAIYTIIFNKVLPSARFIMWFFWFVFLWFVLFELYLFPTI